MRSQQRTLWLPGAAHAGGTQSSNRFAPAGSQHLYSWQRERYALALDLLGRAIERDPGYGIAFAVAGWSYAQLHVNGWTEDQERDRRKGVDLTRRALQISPDDPDVLAIAAFVLGYFGEDIDAAIALIDRCLALNPSFARAQAFLVRTSLTCADRRPLYRSGTKKRHSFAEGQAMAGLITPSSPA